MKLISIPILSAIIFASSFVLCKSNEDASAAKTKTQDDSPIKAADATNVLSNGRDIPLIGMGIGNLPSDRIDEVVSFNLQLGSRLVDTARASRNESMLSKAIDKHFEGAADKMDGSEDNVVHVVTKVWYTHLGYERTKIAVGESLRDLTMNQNVDTRVHILLHWPRCDDNIAWMNCEKEERRLPKYVQEAGPPPHLNKDTAWQDSWKALEDLYAEDRNNREANMGRRPIIESIGISNFDWNDMVSLLDICRIKPLIYQGNVWKVFHDPRMMNLLNENNILFQAYNIMNGVHHRKSSAPNAFAVLSRIAAHLSRTRQELHDDQRLETKVTEGMVIMAWLVQQGISVVPRASSNTHQVENSPSSIISLPRMSSEEIETVKNAMSALMKGEDVKVKAVFHNEFMRSIQLHWMNQVTGEEVPVTDQVLPGVTLTIDSHPGHTFVAYCSMKKLRKEYEVTAEYGNSDHFFIHGEL